MTRLPLVQASSLVLLAACAATGDGSPSPVTVSGVVAGDYLARSSAAGVVVSIGAKSTLSDENGAFRIDDVVPPYDLIAIGTTGAKVAMVYRGLTRTDPTIPLGSLNASVRREGKIEGTVSGGDPPGSPGEQTRLAWGASVVSSRGNSVVDVFAPSYEYFLTWFGPSATVIGNLHLLQWAEANNVPSSYKAYGERTGIPVTSGGTTSGIDIAMSGLTATTVGGAVVLPGGMALQSIGLLLAFDDGARIPLGSQPSPPSPAFSYPFPSLTGGTATLSAVSVPSGGSLSFGQVRRVQPGTTNAVVSVPPLISQLLPVDGAVQVTSSTEFSWTAPGTGQFVYFFVAEPPVGPHPVYHLMTTQTSTRLPDLSSQGLGLPSGVSYTWRVTAIGPHPSLDSAAGKSGIYPESDTELDAFTGGRSFVTQ